jgi:hypothetical protein
MKGKTMNNPHVENANQDMAMFELDPTEIEAVSGGISNDTGYGAALGAAGGFLAMGALGAAALTPVGMGVMLGASIVSSGMAMYYAAQ